MASFWNFIVNKLRNIRYALSPGTRLLTFGAIYYGNYSNWKHDPTPLIWIQYSDAKYTHAINIHYLSSYDKSWLMNTIYILNRAGQIMDGLTFYKLLKQRKPNMVRTAYRVYFTSLLKMRLVSAGITPLDRMVYTNFADPWIARLNAMIKPSEIKRDSIRVAYSPTELQERIASSLNTVDIRQQRVGSHGTAPYTGPAPYVRR